MTGVFAPAARRSMLRTVGLVFAIASVIVPALPFGPLVAQPPLPLAVLWAAYGWASDDTDSWRPPVVLTLLGLLHDQLAGGPYGLYVAIYLIAYLIGRFMANVMSSPNLLSIWGGFAGTALGATAAAYVLSRLALGPGSSAVPFAQAAVITTILFPLVRSFYMDTTLLVKARGRRPGQLRARA